MGDPAKKGRVQRSVAGERRCERCGLQYSKFSVSGHGKWCHEPSSSGGDTAVSTDVVARVVTIGLTPGKPDIAYIRAPEARR